MGGVGQEIGAGDSARELFEAEGGRGPVFRPGEDFDVDLVGCGGGAPVPGGDELGFALFVLFDGAEGAGFSAEERGLGVVDRFAVDAEPLAHLAEAFGFRGGDVAVGVGADVEEVVAALAGDVDEVAEEGFGGLEVGVVGLVAPGVVHGHAGLPVATGEALGRDVLLGRLGVAGVGAAEAVVPDEVGVLVEEGDDLAGEFGRHVFGWGVEPDDDGEVSVVGEEFFELGDGFGVEVGGEVAVLSLIPMESGGLVVAGFVCGAAGSGPVLILGVVEA